MGLKFVVTLDDEQMQRLDGLLRAILGELQGINQNISELKQKEKS
ncbi:MAG: hypothetical protein ACXADD_18410 [Candidatus Thorarchaeota archaeon]|jgi:hypothetical protein